MSDKKPRFVYSQTKLGEANTNLLASDFNSSNINERMKTMFKSKIKKDITEQIANYESKLVVKHRNSEAAQIRTNTSSCDLVLADAKTGDSCNEIVS